MRIDLSDSERLESFAEALGRLFWCLVAVAFFAAILGSAGTGLLVLILAAAAFVVRVGLEDFVRARAEREERAAAPEVTIHRAKRPRPAPAKPRRRQPAAR
jgi:uncharacterized membrane protein